MARSRRNPIGREIYDERSPMRDVRQIFFSKDDVLAAVVYFRQRNGMNGPKPGSIETEFSLRDDGVHTIISQREFGKAPHSFPVDAVEMLATVIQYCFYKKLSLPKTGDRHLDVIGDDLVLTICIPIPG